MEGERGAVSFIVNRSKPFVTEERNGVSFSRIPGRFSICDSVNGNNRRYPKKVWEKNLADGSTLRQAIAKNAAFGLLEHPGDGRISLQSPICILVTDAKLQSGADEATRKPVEEVVGEIIVVNTNEGQKLRALIEVGYNPMVSSRGFGSVVKASDGVDEVQDDYVCEGWDCVLKPSFERAELFVPRENKEEAKLNLWKFLALHLHETGHGQPPAERAGQPSLGPGGVNEPRPTPNQVDLDQILARFKEMVIRWYNHAGKDGNAIWAGWERNGSLSDPDFLSMLSTDTAMGGTSDWKATKPVNYDSAAGRMPPMPPHDWQGDSDDPRQPKVKYPLESKTLPQAASSPAAAAAPSAANKPLTETSMTINEIKARIGAVRGTQVPKDPARFAEGLNEMGQLHQEIANCVAEDAKRGWQGQQLHEEVTRIEKTWSESVLAPSKAAVKLTENYQKVLRVTKVLGEAAINIRKKLSEAMAQNAEAATLIEELTERGQAWVAIADKRKGQVAELEHKLEVSCEALDILKQRYFEDMAEMGRHNLTLEFAEKAQAPEIQKLLKEAKKPADIIAIREKLDPEGMAKLREAEGGSSEECKVCKKHPCICKKENKEGKPAQQEGKATPAAGATLAEARVLVPSVRSISESVAMVQRLSGAKPVAQEEAPKK